MCATSFRYFWVLLLLTAGPLLADPPKITVDHQKPTVQTRLFDPDNPPADMPPLTGDEAAFCAYNLGANASVAYSLRTSSDNRTCQATWTEITLTLTCDITIWLPHGYTPKLQAHEAAHQRIVERIYARSKALADQLARDLAATDPKTDPRRCRASAQEAANKLSNDICNQWLQTTGGRANAVNEAFDRITDHGRNDIPEDQAIQRAFDQAGS